MKPKITVLTLGVDDLERSLRFYRDGLRFETEGIVGEQFEFGASSLFQLTDRLAIGPVASQQHSHDTNLEKALQHSPLVTT